MNWDDEKYVRIFIRETPNWIRAPWEYRVVVRAIMTKLDRTGAIELGVVGEEGWDTLAELIRLPVKITETGMSHALKIKTFVTRDRDDVTVLVMPGFQPAQDFAKTNAERAREYRERKRADLLAQPASKPRAVTKSRDENASRNGVTDNQRNVTEDGGSSARSPVTKSRDDLQKTPRNGKSSPSRLASARARARLPSEPSVPAEPSLMMTATPSRSVRATFPRMSSHDWRELTAEAERIASQPEFAGLDPGDRMDLARAKILQDRKRAAIAAPAPKNHHHISEILEKAKT